jgi:hypothetical protein
MNYTLYNAQQGHAVLKDLWPQIKATLMAGQKLRIEVKQSRRSAEQNDMFHGIIHKIHIAMKGVGSKWTADDWKRLLIDQWAHETNRKIGKVAPSLDGERVVQLGLQSHKFSIDDGSEFIEWLLAWAAQKEIDVN